MWNRLQSLHLTALPPRISLSALRGIPKLAFSSCKHALDLAGLGNCAHLTLRHCGNVASLEGLVVTMSLCIVSCERFRRLETVVPAACRVEIRWCPLLERRELGQVQRLQLIGVPLPVLSEFSCVQALHVMTSSQLPAASFVTLLHLTSLVLEDCNGLTALPDMMQVKQIRLARCSFLKIMPQVSEGASISLDSCWNLRDLTRVVQPCSVELRNLPITRLDMMRGAHRVSVISCRRVDDISHLGTVRCVHLEDLPKITSLGGPEAVPWASSEVSMVYINVFLDY